MSFSQRQLRVGELIRHALSEIFSRGEARDPDLAGRVITVPEVRMSPDLKHATVLVMPLGGEDRERLLAGLERSSGFLRHELARRVELKFLPALKFMIDTRFDDDDRIGALLREPEVADDIEKAGEDD
jgi:ribosome-binding factor A